MAFAAILILPVFPSRADRIELTNGSSFEGRITAETPTHVVVETAGVRIKIKRSSVVKLERMELPPRAAPVAKPGEPTAEQRRTPREFEGTDLKIQQLDAMRNALLPQAHVLSGHAARIEKANAQANAQHAVYAAAMDQLNAFSPGTPAYNKAVDEVNRLAAGVEVTRAEVTRLTNELDHARRAARAYHAAVDTFRVEYQRKKNHFMEAHPDDPSRLGYFPRIEKRLEAHARAGSGVYIIPCRFAGPHAYVKASLNGKAEVEWMVDTGATLCSMGSGLAQKLRLPVTAHSMVTLADGRTARLPIVVVDQVIIGEAIIRNVACFVQDDSLHPKKEKMDGLLGMSFLEHFEVQLDAEQGELTLRTKPHLKNNAP